MSDLADIRPNRTAHNGVVNFVLRENIKFLTGVNEMDILEPEARLEILGTMSWNASFANLLWGASLLSGCMECRRGKPSEKIRARITLQVDVKWNYVIYISNNFSLSIADNVTGGKLRHDYYDDDNNDNDIYLNAIGLTPGASSTVHIYTQTHRIQRTEHT
jgi:hypothetical protein